jgi:hypothetical protein
VAPPAPAAVPPAPSAAVPPAAPANEPWQGETPAWPGGPDRQTSAAAPSHKTVAALPGKPSKPGKPDKATKLAAKGKPSRSEPPSTTTGYLPDHPGETAVGSDPLTPVAAVRDPHDPPTMGYLPAHPPPPREVAAEEPPPPVAAPRIPVQSSKLAPPG